MDIERHLLEDRYLEPLGWVLIGAAIVGLELYTYATAGLEFEGGLMLAVGVVCVLVAGRLWTDRENRADGGNVSPIKHVVLTIVILVIVGGRTIGLA
jgi:hypothetical protein